MAVLASWACAASHGGPAAAAPPGSKAPKARPAEATKSFRPAPLGARNVERVARLWERAVGGYGKAVAVSRIANRVVVATGASGEIVRAFDLWSGQPVGTPEPCTDVIRSGLAFVGSRLYLVCAAELRAFDAKTLRRVQAPSIAREPVTAATFTQSWVALAHRDGVVRLYSLTGSATVEIAVPGPPIDVKSLALTPDAARVAVAWIQGSIWWWNTAAPAAPNPLVRHSNESDAVAFSADGRLLAEEGEPRHTTVWRFSGDAAPAAIAKVRNGDWIKRILFSADGKWLVRGGADGLELAEVEGPRRVALDTLAPVEDVAMDEMGAIVAAVDRKGRLTVWAPR